MWIELHESARQHPKVLRLSRDLAVTWPTAFGYVCALWTWTLTMAPDGDLSSFEPEDIEFGCGWDGEPGILFQALLDRRLLDEDGNTVTVHDWWDFAGSLKAAKRKRKSRKRDGHGTRTGRSRDSRVNVPEDRPTDRPTDRQTRPTEGGDHGAPSQFVTMPPPTLPPIFQVTASHEEAIHRLRDHHAKLHGIKPRGFLTNREDLERIAKSLDEYGEAECQRIIEGHYALVKAGKEDRPGFVFAFPWPKGQRSDPDWDWMAEHHGAKRPVKHHTCSEVDETPEERYRRQQAEEKAMSPEERAEREERAELAKRRLEEMKQQKGVRDV